MCAKDYDNDRSLEKGLHYKEHLRESGPLDGLKLVWVIICYHHINYHFLMLAMSAATERMAFYSVLTIIMGN